VTIDGDPKLRQARERLDAQILDASHVRHQALDLGPEPRELVQVWSEHANGEVRRSASKPLVDAHPEGSREQNRHAGHALQRLPHVCFERLEVAFTIRFEHHQIRTSG
jgi:hypothetical protein